MSDVVVVAIITGAFGLVTALSVAAFNHLATQRNRDRERGLEVARKQDAARRRDRATIRRLKQENRVLRSRWESCRRVRTRRKRIRR